MLHVTTLVYVSLQLIVIQLTCYAPHKLTCIYMFFRLTQKVRNRKSLSPHTDTHKYAHVQACTHIQDSKNVRSRKPVTKKNVRSKHHVILQPKKHNVVTCIGLQKIRILWRMSGNPTEEKKGSAHLYRQIQTHFINHLYRQTIFSFP